MSMRLPVHCDPFKIFLSQQTCLQEITLLMVKSTLKPVLVYHHDKALLHEFIGPISRMVNSSSSDFDIP